MSHFYGTLRGARGPATRQGTKQSGITVVAASWKGCVEVRLWHNASTGMDHYEIQQSKWHGAGEYQTIASGVLGVRQR